MCRKNVWLRIAICRNINFDDPTILAELSKCKISIYKLKKIDIILLIYSWEASIMATIAGYMQYNLYHLNYKLLNMFDTNQIAVQRARHVVLHISRTGDSERGMFDAQYFS